MKAHRFTALVCSLLVLAYSPATFAQDGPPRPDEERARVQEQLGVAVLLDAGAEPRSELRLRPEKGSRKQVEFVTGMAMQQKIGDTSTPLRRIPTAHYIGEVVVQDIADNGDITFTINYASASIRDEPGIDRAALQQMAEAMKSMEGSVCRIIVSERGELRTSRMEFPVGTDHITVGRMQAMTSMPEQFVVPLPEEPVGVGATWRVSTVMQQQGARIRQSITYTLASISDDAVVLDVDVKQDADAQRIENPMMPPMHLRSHEANGIGRIVTALSEVMPATGQVSVTTATTTTFENQELWQQVQQETRISPVTGPPSQEQ